MKVFPARAGMNPRQAAGKLGGRRVPRASGDEPKSIEYLKEAKECSPRERG